MKKLFLIFSSIFTVFVIVILSVTCFIYRDNGIELGLPVQISVYYKSTTAVSYSGKDETLEGEEYEEQTYDEEYYIILSKLESATNLSLMNWLLEEGDYNITPTYSPTGYETYSTDMKSKNLVIEITYNSERNAIVYDGEYARVIPFVCILFVIPINYGYEEMFIYTSLTSDSTQKETQYSSCTPFSLMGDPTELLEYIDSL